MTATDEDIALGRGLATSIGLDADQIEAALREADPDGSAMGVIDFEPMRKRMLTIGEFGVVKQAAVDALGLGERYDNPRDQIHLVVWEKEQSANLEALLNRVVFGMPTLGIVAVHGGYAAPSEIDPKGTTS